LHDIDIVFSPFSPGKYFSETLINDGLFLPILSKSETIPYLQQVSIDPYLWRQLTILYLQQVSINQNLLTHQSHMKKRDMASDGVLIVSKGSISKTKLIVALLNQILAIGLSPVHCLRKFLQI